MSAKDKIRVTGRLGLVVAALLLAGCRRAPEVTTEPTVVVPADDQVAAAVQQTVAAIAVAQTVAALTENGQPPPADTPVAAVATAATTGEELPTPEVIPPPTTTGETAPAALCTVVGGVNLRAGPGTAYDPPLAGLAANTALAPLAFSPVGYPLGQWLQVSVTGTNLIGWVSAGSQWVTCNVDMLALPSPAVIPPTPQPAVPPTAAPTTPIASAPPDIDNEPPGGSFPTDHVFGEVIVDPIFLYRMDVRDLNIGDFEGAGVDFVEFSITGDGVNYFRNEQNAGFCVFGGGEPTCNPWPTDDQGRYTWGEGGPLVQTGDFFASITVSAENEDPTFGTSWNWNFPFRVTLP